MILNLVKTVLVVPCIIALGFSLSTSSYAQDFSKGSNAKEWGLIGEEKATFTGKVVDVLCQLSGDCPANCGNGTRNLGVLRSVDNKLIFVTKNSQPAFNGATEDLLPYCGKDVDVDGVMVGENEKIAKVFLLQFIRIGGEEKWNKANLWTKKWQEKNPNAKGKGPWFRRDSRVAKQIKANGYFGLGHEEDERWRKAEEEE